MNNLPLLNDLRVFMLVARRAGFAAAAEELGVSPAFVSKRVSLLEQTLNVQLLHRTTRRVAITEEGERIYEWGLRILQDVDQMMDELSDVRQVPQGTLRIISSFGFGRRVVAPALSELARRYPQLEIRFDVADRLVDLANEGSIWIFALATISPQPDCPPACQQSPHPLRLAGVCRPLSPAKTAQRSRRAAVSGDQRARPALWRLAAAR